MEENYNGTDLNGLEIAVIGMAGRFPGARHLDEFWENLKKGKELISFFTGEELEGLGVDRALLENPLYVKSNSFLEDKEYFDASFFGYLPNEAEIMDPQIRLFHECAWETLEYAGYNPGIYKGLIGVYAGIGPSFYWEALTLLSGRSEVLGAFESSQLSSKDYLCTRISYKLDLKGPSFVVDTACSTSLVAIHLACQGLLNGECDMALVGGVKISHLGQPGYLYQEGMIMSPDGHCRAFDAKANGIVSGEGIGIVLLKRLEDAVNDGDFIHALIKGSAINNDGIQKVGYTAPGVEGQMQVIKSALHMAEVEPDSISYIETHGTGTVLGDPIEIKALKRAFASTKKRFCALGSVKTNIGHLDRAAGVAGFIKAVLALKHRQIPPSLHFEAPNPELGLEDSPFYVNNRLCPWKNDKYPLRAGVSSFGFGGTNAHVVLEAWSVERGAGKRSAGSVEQGAGKRSAGSVEQGAGSEEGREYQLVLLSAKTETALEKMTENLVNYFKKNPVHPVNPKNPVLPDAAYTLQVGRQPFKYRRMTIGANFDERVQTFSVKKENIPVVFMFPGQGSQYVDMALDLYHSEPVFREEMDRCFDILTPIMGYNIKEILYPFNRSYRSYRTNINQTEIAQPVIFALEYSLAKLLMGWGIRPHAMIGHSIGEYTAACLAGVFSLEDALLLVAWRGKLMQQMPAGAMLSVPLPENEIKPLLDDQLSLAAVNGVSLCVVSGPEAQVELLAKKLKEDGHDSRLLHTSHAFHSAMMEPVLKAFEEKLEQVRFNEPKIPYISNLTGDWITIEAAANPDYWTRHLRETVRFADGLKELLKEGNCVFVEVGPGKALSTFVRQHPAKTTGHWVLNLIKHPKETVKDDYFLLSKVGQLWLYGVHIDWFAFHGAEKRLRIPLPTYPFERQRFWIEGSPFDIGREMLAGKSRLEKKKDMADWFYVPQWTRSLLQSDIAGIKKTAAPARWLVFTDACGLGEQLVKQLEQQGQEVFIVRQGPDFGKEEKQTQQVYVVNPAEEDHYEALFKELLALGKLPDRVIHLWSLSGKAYEEPGIETFEKVLDSGFHSLVHLVQALGRRGNIPAEIRIGVVSDHMHEVTGEERPNPAKTALLGAVKVIPLEYPNISCFNIDVLLPGPGSEGEKALVYRVLEEFNGKPSYPVMAFRGNYRWVQVFEPIRLEKIEGAMPRLKQGGTYVITGGLGGIGLTFAEFLARAARVNLVLISRSPFSKAAGWQTAKVQELERLGSRVMVTEADVSDLNRMEEVLARVRAQRGPINGIFHAAGLADYAGVIQRRSRPETEAILTPKVKGTLVLDRVTREDDLDFFILCSALSSLRPPFGQVAYAAANAFLDGFAYYSSAAHKRFIISVNWDAWQERGMAANSQFFIQHGILPAEGMEIFSRLLGTQLRQVAVSTRDLEVLLEQPHEHEIEEPVVSPMLRQRPELSTSYVAPRNEIEQQLVEVWQSFFGFQPVGTLDDFFELGGDSLKIITVVSRIHKELEVEVPLAEFFAHPNIRSIAGYIEKTAGKNLYLSIEPVEEKEYYPLTADLLRMYILNELEGVSTAYNLPLAMKIEGRLDKERFEETFRWLIKRHESFRTSFRMKGEYPVQVIHKDVDFRVRYLEESAGSSWDGDEIRNMARRFSQPFDLTRAPLLRVVLIRLSENEHLLFLDMHHIISDGISTAVLVREFSDIYMGGELPELRIQYKDFSEWLHRLFQAGEIKKQEDYWLECFKGDIPVLNMPTDYPRPAVQSFEGDKIRFSLEEAFSRRLRSFTRESNATLYMVLLAAYDILLARYTGQEDIVVGSPVAGRNHTELEHVIGMFLKILVMRNEPLGNKTFSGFLGEVRDTTLTAYENQLYPFRDLVDKVGAGNDLSRNPLFDAMLLVQNIDAPSTNIEGLTFTPYDVNTGFSKVDIFLEAMDTRDGLHLSFEYCTKLFKKNTIERFAGHFVNVLEEVVNNPETRLADIDIMDREEKRQLLEEFNHSGQPPVEQWQKPVQRLFEEQVDRTPDRIALVGALHRLTYRTYRTNRTYITYLSYKTLNEASNRLARMLRKKGIGPDRIVALLMDRSMEMIFAILGILKAGGVYLPIDPEYPEKRILYILEESRAAILLTKEEISKHIPFTSLVGLNSVEFEPRVTAKRPQIKDFDSLPLPDRSLVDYEKYHQYIGEALARHTTTIQATRGCPFRCAFCHKIWPKNHVYRSAENIFHEVQTLYDIGARRFMFVDDIFNLRKENCTRFFELIIKNGLNVQLFFANGLRGDILTGDMMDLMVEAGTVDFDFSLESASPRMQKLMQKNLDIEKLRETINYLITHHPHVIIELQTMIGFPTETEQEAMMTLDFIKSLKWIDFPYVHFLRIYPGTDMVKIAVENGISPGVIERSANLAFHEYAETMPFPEEFAKMYQQKYFHEYFLVKERFVKMLQKQMKILTESELIQKYDSFFPTEIRDFSQLLDLVGISREDLQGAQFPAEDYMVVPDINKKLARVFPQKEPEKNALRILLLDVSQFFSQEAEMFYDVSEAPLGLMYLLTYLNKEYGGSIDGKIAKSRMDFDSYEELHALVTDFKPAIIGVRALSHYKDFFHKTISLLRQWGIDVPIIAGGPYATGSYAEVLKHGAVDVVVLGEGETTFSEIIGKVLENNGKFPDETTLKDIKGIAFFEQAKKSIMRKINREIMFLDEAGEAFNREENTNLELPGRLTDLAYIIYTSGSTGQPKGVTVEHKNLMTYLNAFNNEFRVTAEDTVLQQASYSFDTFMEEVYPALLAGGKIAVPGKETVMDVYRLSDFIQKQKITIVDCSPLLLHQLNKPDAPRSLRWVRTFISGGDVLKGEYIDNLLKIGDVYNTYGPTEATICAAYYKCSGEEMAPYVSIGKPIAGYNLYILDKNGGPVPIGVPGELCIAGDGVTRGYLNNPELTNSKFQIPNYKQIPNSKLQITNKGENYPLSFSASQLLSFSLYRTGDLARWLPDGNIDFLGRLDHQVKIRGYRIELGEIQDRLLAHEQVLDAVVSVREDEQGDKYLCAYVVAWSMEHGAGRELESRAGTQLRDYLSRALPDYMVPAHFVQLEQIPLTSNGKVDYKALPDPLEQIEAGEGYTPPRDETEEKLVQVWSEVLGIDKGRISINTSFFHLGGHSLKATLVVTRLHKDLDIKISLFEVFSRPTIRELAEYVRGMAADRHVPLEAVEKREYYILSSAQKRLYIQQQRDPDTTAFNLPQVFVLEGELKVKELEKTFRQLIRRHESLRTSFHIIEDEPVQRLHKDVIFEIEYVDMINDFIKAFDLTKAPLLRVGLIKEAAQRHLLLIDLHHIISDAVSQGILVRDFITLFSGGRLPFINIQYKDFAQWQESPEQRKRIKQQETYWLKRFAGEIPCLNMPTDFERPEIQSFEGDILHFYVEGELYLGVRECMTETGTTLYMVLLAVYTILLSRYTRQQDIVVGSPVTGRTHDGLQNIMGMFVNMLPMRNKPSGDKAFKEFLKEVKENALEAYDNQDYPFDELVIKLGLQGSSRPPVFETAFTLQDVELSGMGTTGEEPAALRARPCDRFEHHIAQYDVTLDAIELKNAIHLWMRYVTALFKPATIDTFKNYFLEILWQVVEKPGIKIEDIRLSHEKIAVKSSIHKEDAGDFVF